MVERREGGVSAGPWIPIAILLLVVALVLVVVLIGGRDQSPLVGRWQSTALPLPLTLVVHPDGVASLSGVRCEWVPVDERTIRIEACFGESDSWIVGLLSKAAGDFRLTANPDSAVLIVAIAEIDFARLLD